MSLFEFVTAGYTLLLSFAILRVLTGLPHAMRIQGRYWVYVSWLILALLFCLVTFIGFWPYHGVEWTTLKILGALAIPGSLYAYCSLLVPPDPAAVTDWKAYFFSVRVPLFAIGVIFYVVVILSNQLSLGTSPFHISQLSSYFYIAIYIVGLCTVRPSVHVALPIAIVIAIVIEAALLGDADPIALYGMDSQ